MKTNNKEMTIYVQPTCKVYLVQLQHIVAASDTGKGSRTEKLQEEDYLWD